MCKSVESPSDKKEKKLFQRQCTVQTIHTIIILEFDLRSSQHPAKKSKVFLSYFNAVDSITRINNSSNLVQWKKTC